MQRPEDIEAARMAPPISGKISIMDNIDVEIDEMTPCLKVRATGEKIETKISKASLVDVTPLRKAGWKFDWKKELIAEREVLKLTLEGEDEIQGLVSMTPDRASSYVFVHLVESAPHNIGGNGKMIGVGGHLFAIAAEASVEMGFDGFVAFEAKTALIPHYERELGAQRIGSVRMVLDELAAQRLIDIYMHGRRVSND